MKSKGFLLATAATGAAVAPGALAADLPAKVPAPVVVPPAASWAGWYIGLHAGANWHQAQNSNFYAGGGQTALNSTGFIGGGQIGFNWQNGNFVFGIEADGSWLSGKASDQSTLYGTPTSNRVHWLATVRPRFGLAVGNTMAYVTGGVAFGGVKNTLVLDAPPTGIKSESKTRVGWAIGGGIEHMWTRNWTVSLEGLFVDLGRSTVTASPALGGAAAFKTTRFSNQVVIGRFKLNYKW